ncbi:hypothetical protein SAMN04487967_2893 [Natronorubrum sediminis]|uniref:DUF7310 domain-containing protein n=2 Tax=Natronorubrum sediminis TaxID=640943 RepID=A0A1H6G2X5_9EURY|nr:hypothetical protein SAMN04487967_2893 [Natronorubrum sediminis]
MVFKYDGAANTPMTDIERIDQRLSAVERAVVDNDLEFDRLEDLATLTATVDRLEARLEEHERRLAELEGSVDAVSGFVDNVGTVNDGVERRADAAIAAVDRLEYRLDEFERVLANRDAANPTSDRVDEAPGVPPARSSEAVQAESGVAVSAESAARSERDGISAPSTLEERPDRVTASAEAVASDLLDDAADEMGSERESPAIDEHASNSSEAGGNESDSRSFVASLRARFA